MSIAPMDEQNSTPTLNEVMDEVENGGVAAQALAEAIALVNKAEGYEVKTANGKKVKPKPPQSVLDRVNAIAALMPTLHKLHSDLRTEVREVVAVDGGKWKDQLPFALRPLKEADGGVIGNLRAAIALSLDHTTVFKGTKPNDDVNGKVDTVQFDGDIYISGLDPLTKTQDALHELEQERAGLAEDSYLVEYYDSHIRKVRQKRDELSKNGKRIPILKKRDNPANATTQEAKSE